MDQSDFLIFRKEMILINIITSNLSYALDMSYIGLIATDIIRTSNENTQKTSILKIQTLCTSKPMKH